MRMRYFSLSGPYAAGVVVGDDIGMKLERPVSEVELPFQWVELDSDGRLFLCGYSWPCRETFSVFVTLLLTIKNNRLVRKPLEIAPEKLFSHRDEC